MALAWLALAWLGLALAAPAIELSTAAFEAGGGRLSLGDGWRYRVGDRREWAAPGFDDRDWSPLVSTSTLHGLSVLVLDDVLGDTSTLWLRLDLEVDPALQGQAVALDAQLYGAAEVWLDGRRIGGWGEIDNGDPPGGEVIGRGLLRLQLPESSRAVLALRYSSAPDLGWIWLDERRGLRLEVGPVTDLVRRHIRRDDLNRGNQIGIMGVLLAQGFLHLALFWFYRRERSNLDFAILAAVVAALVFFGHQQFLAIDPGAQRQAFRWWQLCMVASFVALTKFAYSLGSRRRSLGVWVVGILGIAIAIVVTVRPTLVVFTDFWWLPLVAVVLSLRAFVQSMIERRRGAVILITGLSIFGLSLVGQFVIARLGVSLGADSFRYLPIAYYGTLVLTSSVSVYLARGVADTQHDLEHRLAEVERLSNKTLEQERAARDLELERRLLEADNLRKTEELQAAREFQLSLLPDRPPGAPGYDVNARMRSAVEVGGDYYDYRVEPDRLLLAIGDATGHGARAGAMMSMAKALFSSWPHDREPGAFLDDANQALAGMRLRGMLMSMGVSRVAGGTLVHAAAGMPPGLLYRRRTATAEELLIESLPLGARAGARYSSYRVELEPGDVVMWTTDGLPELASPAGEVFGYQRLRQEFLVAAQLGDAWRTTEHMMALIERWKGGGPPDDDVVVAVVRRLEEE